jgi:hypothetical protein
MRRAFQVFLGLFGGTVLCICLLHLVLGPASIPGSVPVNATMDSEDRFYGTLFGAYGIAVLSCIEDVERKRGLLHFLLAAFFAGGIARLVSMAVTGPPHPLFTALTVVELAIPVLAALAYRRIVRLSVPPGDVVPSALRASGEDVPRTSSTTFRAL